MQESKVCPSCHRTNPADALTCHCGYRFDHVSRSHVDTAQSAGLTSPVRITEIRLTFGNVFGLVARFWFASLLWSLIASPLLLAVYFLIHGLVSAVGSALP